MVKMKCEIIRRMSQETMENKLPQLNKIAARNDQPRVMNKQTEEEDYLEKTIGAFGLWQAVISITVTLTRPISMWNMMSIIFLTPVTEFNCVEFSNNVSFEVKNCACYDNCLRYEYSSAVPKNIIEEFQLICQNAWLASFTQFIMMFGVFFGVSFFGWISDRFGRRAALLLSTAMNSVFMISLYFSSNIIIFCFIRFMTGFATGGSMIICLVYVLEIVGRKYREIAGACCLLPDGIAEASLAAFAYLTPNWQTYTLSYGVVTCLFFILMIFVPESPRWLISNGKIDEAVNIITRAAKRNKLDTSNITAIISKAVEDIRVQDRDAPKTRFLYFCKTKKIFFLTSMLSVMWFGLGICYFRIYQYATIIGMNPYLTIIILGLIQLPLCPVEIILNKKLGRKNTIIGSMFIVGVTMTALIFVPEKHWVGNLLGVIGFSIICVAVTIAYIQVSELFATPLRNKGYGITSSVSRIGAMIAPFVANILPRWIPSLIFGIMSFVTGICCLFLPETKGQNLKDTIEN